MSIQTSYDLVANEFSAVNDTIISQLVSEVTLVEDISQYLVTSGGKRIRPLVTLLCAGAVNNAGNPKQITLAAVIEFLHTATLLHDDVVDMSNLRRGKPTANANWGNAPSVLVGDFVYSRAFQMMVSIGSLKVMEILSDTTTKIAEGEVKQLDAIGDINLSEAGYFQVIHNKTAQLFIGACESVATIAQSEDLQLKALSAYGKHLGLAFQLVDDYLDYAGETNKLGKQIGDDLTEGKLTLPLIHAIEHATPDDKQLLINAVEEKDSSKIDQILSLFKTYGSMDYTLAKAKEQVSLCQQAIEALPPSAYRDALHQVSDFVLARTI